MKKLKLVAVCIIIILVGMFLKNENGLFQFDFGKTVDLSRFQLMATDNDGNIYGIYSEKKEDEETKDHKDILYKSVDTYIMKITPENEIDFAITNNKINQTVKAIEVDENKNVYVHYINHHYDIIRVESEEVVMYDLKGKEVKGIVKYKYTSDKLQLNDNSDILAIDVFLKFDKLYDAVLVKIEELGRYSKGEIKVQDIDEPLYEVGRIKSIEISKEDNDTFLTCYTLVEVEGGREIEINNISISDSSLSNKRSIALPIANEPLFIENINSDELCYVTVDGSLYYVNKDDESLYISVDKDLEFYTITNIAGWDNENEKKIVLEIEKFDGSTVFYSGNKEGFTEDILTRQYISGENFICTNEKEKLYYHDGETVVSKEGFNSFKYNRTATISNRYFIWQMFYINMIIFFIVLILLFIYLYFNLILKNHFSVILRQSIFMLAIFSIFAFVMMNYIETMFLEQATMMDGNTIEVFENVLDEKLDNPETIKSFNILSYLADLKVKEIKRINDLTDSKTKETAIKQLYKEIIEKDIIQEIEVNSYTDYNKLVILINEKYNKYINSINTLSEESLKELEEISIKENSYFITLYNIIIDNNLITDANTIANTNDSNRTVHFRDVRSYIGDSEHQKSYLDGDFVSNYSEDGKWIRTGKLLSYEEKGQVKHFIFRLGMNSDGYTNSVIATNINTLDATMRLLIVIAMLLLLLSIRFTLNPIKELTKSVLEITEYDEAPELSIDRNDEIGALSKAFNDLLNDIKVKFQEQINIYKVYSKYVPKEYETFLDKNILDLELGDFCEKEMTVLCFYVHDMFELIESFGNQKLAFIFVKEYLDQVSKVIRRNTGIVTRYDDGGIMAIFESNSSAVLACIGINERIDELNKMAKRKLNIGIGLNRGNLLLGVVGETSRMQLSVISKHSTIAIDLAKRTKDYASKVLITHQVMEKTVPTDKTRCLGYVLPLNSDNEIIIYDLFDSDNEVDFEKKESTKELFADALSLYQQGDFINARQKFRKVIDSNHNDLVAQKYYFLADEYKFLNKNEIPYWSPILK